MGYKIGLDIGITSVGWAVLELNNEDEPKRIIDLGTRIFDAAENPKDGSSLAKPRRDARGARRRLRRHRHRIERIKQLIKNSNLLTSSELESLYDNVKKDIYEIRVKALDSEIDRFDFARLLIHLAQRRGFKSNKKSDANDKEAGSLLSAVEANKKLMAEKGYRTIGEMLYKDEKFKDHKRNKGDDYSHTVDRKSMEDEIKLIFKSQRQFGNPFATQEFEKKYLDIYLSQRSFDEGPGGNSPYGGSQIEKMIGNCTFEDGEKRAAKACFSFEYFTLLQKVNSIRLNTPKGIIPLNKEQRDLVINLAFTTPDLKYAAIRKKLDLSDDETFVGLSGKDIEETEKKTKLGCMKAYHEIRKALDKVSKGRIKALSHEQLDDIGLIMTKYKSDENIRNGLLNAGIDKVDVEALLLLPGFSKFGHLSLKACRKLIPFLEQGLTYDKACEAAGYDFKAHSDNNKRPLLPQSAPELEDITNPVVRRAISQTIKVINAIIRKYGSPSFISVELAREMSKDFTERKKLEKLMKENQEYNERIAAYLKDELKIISPTGQDIVKYKLWKEQDGICPYSLTTLEINRLFEPGYCDVDHIIPYSISFDDSYKNKVLVKSNENRQKGNRLPLEYLSGERKEKFIVWVNNNVKDTEKKLRLLKEKITEEDINKFKERNLNDTKYISRFMLNYINDYLQFADSSAGRKKRVTAVNGAVTSFVRKRWGIAKIREDGDLHHAADAAVIACITDGMIQKISRYSKYHENYYYDHDLDKNTGELLEKFPMPYPTFRKELEIRLSNSPSEYLKEIILPNYEGIDPDDIKPVFVSRMPKRKAKGAAHKDTLKSPKALSEGYTIVKRPLNMLKLDKDGEIEGYYNPSSDLLLYNALKERLKEFNGKADKAFAGEFRKPTSSGKPGPIVKKVKIMEKSSLVVGLNKGRCVADNDSMIRIDVFYVENDGYYFVPIYVADTLKPTLPNKAVIAFKPADEWKEMNDKDFIFSLYPNDLIKIKTKSKKKFSLVNPGSTLDKELLSNEFFAYYISANITIGTISIINHDNTYQIKSLGIKTLESIEKYQVDVLGNYSKVKREKRQYFRGCCDCHTEIFL